MSVNSCRYYLEENPIWEKYKHNPESASQKYYTYQESLFQRGKITEIGPDTRSIKIPKDENEGHPGMYALGVFVTVLAAGAFLADHIIYFPSAGPTSLLALGILSAVTYGIINDQLACRQCIHYFTIGHTQRHKRLLKTDNPTLNGIVWGIHATWIRGAVAGVVLAGTALATGLTASDVLPLLITLIAIGGITTCIYAHIEAKKEEKEWQKPEKQEELAKHFTNNIILPVKGYHPVHMRHIPSDKRAAYMGVGKRNAIGYKVMPIFGRIACIGLITLGMIRCF